MNCSLIKSANAILLGICALFAAACTRADASEFEYIFWGKIASQNLLLSDEEYHLSRSMRPSAGWDKWTQICSVVPASARNSSQPASKSSRPAGKLINSTNFAKSPNFPKNRQNREIASHCVAVNEPEACSQKPLSAAEKLRAKLAADADIIEVLRANKPALIDCAKRVKINSSTKSQRLAAATSTRVAMLPFRFRAERAAGGEIIIYARN